MTAALGTGAALTIALSLCSCQTGDAPAGDVPDATVADGGDAGDDSSVDAQPPDASESDDADADADGDLDGAPDSVATTGAPPGSFCSLPGSVIWSAQGPTTVPTTGADASGVDVSWLHVPPGFCAHYFATVKTARQLRFAPGGELFAASPSSATTGGANNGTAAIMVLSDDDHDGFAEGNAIFLPNLRSVQGLMFAGGYLYYQDGPIIRRVAYATGDRSPTGASEVVSDMSGWPQDGTHWPKVFDIARDGTFYVTNGGSQADACLSAWPPRGGVFRLTDGGTTPVAIGLRNPIAMRCEQDHDVCLVVELALDYSAASGGREKLVSLRQGDNWGFPCCATQNLPYQGARYFDTGAVPDCSSIPQESDGFVIGHTPFGIDFETGRWPAPWTRRAFVTLHGVVGSWVGARVVGIALDPQSGLPLPATELDGGSGVDPNSMLEFATGWDDGRQDHGRPAPVVFAPDGRMFLGDDQRGAIVWIAPTDLMIPPP